MKKYFWRGIFALLLVTLACRPVLAIGWNEILVFFLLSAVLFGPPLLRFIQRVGDFLRREKKDK